MYSRNHAAVSAVVGGLLVIPAPSIESMVFLWTYVLLLGVGIDCDHFLIARINRGEWSNLRQCIREPSRVFLNQASIFDTGDVYRDQRLFSHLLIGGFLATLLWTIDTYWALATAITVYTHLLADVYADIRTRDEYLRRNGGSVRR